MSKRIVIDLNNIDKAIQDVQDYEKEIKRKLGILTERLAELGAKIAKASFENALYAGYNDVEVSVEPVENANGYKVVAKGQAVLFIEFGTGITNPEHPQQGEIPGIVPHGEYGKKRGKQIKGWVYKGVPGNAGKEIGEGKVHTLGNPPSRSMYQATKDMQAKVYEIAKEVFSS